MKNNYQNTIYITLSTIILTFTFHLSAEIFTVTKTTDSSPTISGELRWAIHQCNNHGGHNTIAFNIPGDGPFTITPTRDLDDIVSHVTIDGYTQSGASENTDDNDTNTHLMIELNGNNYRTGNAYHGTGNGLTFKGKSAAHSIVKGLVINRWINTGIFIINTNDIEILGNYIGTNTDGVTERANQAGIFIASSENITIGKAHKKDRNLIAGSFFYFNESGCITVKDSHNTTITNNYIGINAINDNILGNSLVGIECIGSSKTTIENNIVIGHEIMGISIIDSQHSIIRENIVAGIREAGISKNNIGISLAGKGQEKTTQHNHLHKNIIFSSKTGIKLGYASAIGTNNNLLEHNIVIGNDLGLVINDNSNIITKNRILENQVGGVLIYGKAINNIINDNNINSNYESYHNNAYYNASGYGMQIGLAGALTHHSSNTVENNTFPQNNTISALCP